MQDTLEWSDHCHAIASLDHRVAFNNLTKDHVLTIQVTRGNGAKEELAAIGIWA